MEWWRGSVGEVDVVSVSLLLCFIHVEVMLSMAFGLVGRGILFVPLVS